MASRLLRVFVAGASAAVVVLSAAQGAAAARWSTETAAVPPGSSPFTILRGVSCASSSSCTAVGGFFTSGSPGFVTLVERWDGTSWTIQSTPNASGASDSELMAVSCPSTTACVAVGFSDVKGESGNMPLAESWDGSSWTLRSVPLPAEADSGYLEGVSCATATGCIAVGSYDNAAGSFNAFAARWDGSNWTLQNAVSPTGNARLHAVSCTSATACTAVGLLGGTATGGASLTLAERWDGTAWSVQSTPSPVGLYMTELRGGSCSSATACTAVGYYTSGFSVVGTPLAEQWNGTSWSIQPTPKLPKDGALNGVSCTSASACAAVGTGSKPLAEAWDGTRWTLQHVPDAAGASYSELNGVSCATTHECIGVGYYYSDTDFIDRPLIVRYS